MAPSTWGYQVKLGVGEPFRWGPADASGGDPEHKPLTFVLNPWLIHPPRECRCFPAMRIKTALLSPVGRMSLSLTEEGERQGTHAVTTVGICTGEITKGRPTLCVPSSSYCHIVLFVPWAVNSLFYYPCHILRDGSGRVWTACKAP